MEGVRRPADVIHELIVVTVPVELCISDAPGEWGEAATGVCVGADFEDVVALAVAEQQVAEAVAARNAPCVEACAVTVQNFEFCAVIALENVALDGAQGASNNFKAAHAMECRKVAALNLWKKGVGARILWPGENLVVAVQG